MFDDIKNAFNPIVNGIEQATDLFYDGYHNYALMREGWKFLDDYYHCKANYQAAAHSPEQVARMKTWGELKEAFDFYRNLAKGFTWDKAITDFCHDLQVNQIGRDRAQQGLYNSSYEACADYRQKNKKVPLKVW